MPFWFSIRNRLLEFKSTNLFASKFAAMSEQYNTLHSQMCYSKTVERFFLQSLFTHFVICKNLTHIMLIKHGLSVLIKYG